MSRWTIPVIRVELNGEFQVKSVSMGQTVCVSLSAFQELNSSDEYAHDAYQLPCQGQRVYSRVLSWETRIASHWWGVVTSEQLSCRIPSNIILYLLTWKWLCLDYFAAFIFFVSIRTFQLISTIIFLFLCKYLLMFVNVFL